MHFFDLAQSVEFKESGPSVRAIARSPHFRQILFGFKAGQGLREHVAPIQISVQVIFGLIKFGVADQIQELESGQQVLLEAGVQHSVEAVDDTVMLLSMYPDPQSNRGSEGSGSIESLL
jgi:quercetin dioxygenase-like cupin family protein